MNQYYTEVQMPEFDFEINYESKLLFIGSCFAESIGAKVQNFKFSTTINPFGILYNPLSIANGLDMLMDNQKVDENKLFQQNELWKSLDFHSRFSHVNKEITLNMMNDAIAKGNEALKQASYLFITFGTSWIYEWKESGQVVANCHKFPSQNFNRRKMSIQEIKQTYCKLIGKLKELNPKLKIIFTLSPIRHWKDGAHGNQLSKSTLLLAISEIIENKSNYCYYFPSYEIVLDELRDYRFYGEDLLHLNNVAIEHVWQKTNESIFAKSCQSVMTQIAKLNAAINHRPSNTKNEEYKKFVKTNIKLIENIEKQNQLINLAPEKKHFGINI